MFPDVCKPAKLLCAGAHKGPRESDQRQANLGSFVRRKRKQLLQGQRNFWKCLFQPDIISRIQKRWLVNCALIRPCGSTLSRCERVLRIFIDQAENGCQSFESLNINILADHGDRFRILDHSEASTQDARQESGEQRTEIFPDVRNI